MQGNQGTFEGDATVKLTKTELQDIRNALSHAMNKEFSVSRAERHEGQMHEQAQTRYARYEKLYVEVEEVLGLIG